MRTTLYILSILLYLNYRIIYSVFLHKTVYSFKEFAIKKETDKAIPIIFTINIIALSLLIFTIKTALIIIIASLSLNLIVKGVQSLKKRLWK
jgi:hypothetical protein